MINEVLIVRLSSLTYHCETLFSLYLGKEFLEACNICNGRDHNVASIPAAEQTKTFLNLNKLHL